MAQIRTLLTTHAAAVRRHDSRVFDAGLATGKGAAAFRTAQRAAFRNLTELDLSGWSYTLEGRTDDRSAEAAATKSLGSPAVVYRVTLRYGLSGYDPSQTSHTLYWTFVDAGGRAVVAGDSAVAAAGGASWKGPWDFGPLTVARGTSVLVLAHASAGNLSPLVAAVDEAAPQVTAVWGTGWPRRVVVLVPASETELSADTGNSSQISSAVAAAAVFDGSDPLSNAPYGARLVVNPPALAKLSTAGRQITLRHEITHIAAGAATGEVAPRWLVEGLADYVGLLPSGQSVTTAAAELARQVRAGKLPEALPPDPTFDGSTAAVAYEGGWLACRLIARDAGQAGLLRFYRLVGESLDTSTAVPDALGAVLHLSVAQFTAQWRGYLRSELG